MITLGIETSCDETSAAIVCGGRILSNVVQSSLKEHSRYGGVIPEIAHRAHMECLVPVIGLALRKARKQLADISLVAVTQGPGLMGSLLVGSSAARALAWSLNKPLIGVDHVLAHIHAVKLEYPKIRFPFLGLVVSGGHTLLLRIDGPNQFLVLGKTLDDAAGEAYDKVAKMLGIGYPGGPEVDRLAESSSEVISFSQPMNSKDSPDFSFSGIKTAVFYQLQKLGVKAKAPVALRRKICGGFQRAMVGALVDKTIRQAREQGLRNIVVGGGVSANKGLRKALTQRATQMGYRVYFPSMSLCQDNAAMIASLGEAMYRKGVRSSLNMQVYSDFYHGNKIRRV